MGLVLSELAVLFEHAQVGVVSLRADKPLVHGLLDGAARLMRVRARDEAAIVRAAQHFREILVDFFFLQVHEAEAPEPRSIDDIASLGEAVHLVQ